MVKRSAARVRLADYFHGLLNIAHDKEPRICAVSEVNVPVMTKKNEIEFSFEVPQPLRETKVG